MAIGPAIGSALAQSESASEAAVSEEVLANEISGTTSLFRAMSPAEAEGLLRTGTFKLGQEHWKANGLRSHPRPR